MSEVSAAEIAEITPKTELDRGKENPLGLQKLRENPIVKTAVAAGGYEVLSSVLNPALALGVFLLASAGEHSNLSQGWKSS